ncbi:MAG: hypothetical protein OQK98_06065 [Gammaproteobacteria bacterium]|nr:hypothetical protein [Gammaproteobacteria bacterium]
MSAPKVVSTREEKLVILLVLSVLVLLEIAIRLNEDRLSGNISHIYTIPEIARQASDTTSDANLIFLGNSLTNNAIDKPHIETLNSSKNSIKAFKITPDGTAISDWYCIYNQYFLETTNTSSFVIIGFAWGQLSDQFPINPTRLGGFFCQIEDIDALEATGLTRHQQFLRFLAGSVSHVYVNREAIRNRVLDTVVPYYKETTQVLNRSPQNNTEMDGRGKSMSTYTSFTNLNQSIKSSNRQLVVMAMPVIDNYSIDAELLDTFTSLGIPLLDLRNVEKIEKNMFLDSIHLNAEGSRIFTEALVEKLQPYISNDRLNTLN